MKNMAARCDHLLQLFTDNYEKHFQSFSSCKANFVNDNNYNLCWFLSYNPNLEYNGVSL